jgi:hypothetical protein
MCFPLQDLQRVPRSGSDRQLRGGEIRTADVCSGSRLDSGSADLVAWNPSLKSMGASQPTCAGGGPGQFPSLATDGVSSITRLSSMQQLRPVVQLPFNQPEVTMSADKHRGIRRQKQKRAKDRRKKGQQQPTVVPPSSSESSTQQKTE